MAKYILYPFAVTGNRLAVPNPAQPSGNLSWQEGFPINYQLDPETEPTAKLIERQQFNQFMYDLSQAIQQYQQFGVADFITTDDNGGTAFPYSQFARCRYDNKVYESLVDNNTALPTDATKWAQVSANSGSVPPGAQMAYGGITAPDGWLLCYGQAVSRTTFSALFAAIGTNYGIGDGINTFNVPDKRGRVSIGRDNMGPTNGNGTAAGRITTGANNAGFDGTQIGAAGGSQNMQQHAHTINDPGHTHSLVNQTVFSSGNGGNPYALNSGTNSTGSATTGITVNNSGNGASGNVQPGQVDTWIIKT